MTHYKYKLKDETADQVKERNKERKLSRIKRQADVDVMNIENEKNQRNKARLMHENLRQKNSKKIEDDASDINSYLNMKSKAGGHIPTRKHILEAQRKDQDQKVEDLLTNKKLNFQDL